MHRALDHAVALEEGLVGVGQHVDDGVADGDDIEGLGGHGGLRRARNGTRVASTPDRPLTRSRTAGAADRTRRPTASGIGTLSLIPLPTPERAVPDQPSPTATIDADSPYRLPRTVVPVALRPRARARPGGRHLRRHVRHGGRGRRAHAHRRLQRHRARGVGRVGRVRRRHAPSRPRRSPSTRSPSGSPLTFDAAARAGHLGAAHRVHAASSTTSCTASTAAPSPTTPASSRSSPPPSSRPPTPGGPSRAGTSPTSRPSSRVTLVVDDELAAVSNAAEVEPRAPRRRQARRALRRHHDDVDLPGRLHRRPARDHRPGRRRRHAAAGRLPGRQGPPHRLRPRGRRVLPRASSPTTSASPTRATRSTSSPCPTSRSAPWRTSAASPSARRSCWSTPTRSPSPSCSGSPT